MTKWILKLALLFGIVACTDAEPRVEEPVQMEPAAAPVAKPPLMNEDAAGNAAEGSGAESNDAESSDADMAAPMDGTGGETPMAAPTPPTGNTGNGGIISSGEKATPRDQCQALESLAERKKCLQKLKKKR